MSRAGQMAAVVAAIVAAASACRDDLPEEARDTSGALNKSGPDQSWRSGYPALTHLRRQEG